MLSFKRVRAWVVPVAMLACLHLTGAVAAAGSKSGKGPGNGKLDQLLAEFRKSSEYHAVLARAKQCKDRFLAERDQLHR